MPQPEPADELGAQEIHPAVQHSALVGDDALACREPVDQISQLLLGE